MEGVTGCHRSDPETHRFAPFTIHVRQAHIRGAWWSLWVNWSGPWRRWWNHCMRCFTLLSVSVRDNPNIHARCDTASEPSSQEIYSVNIPEKFYPTKAFLLFERKNWSQKNLKGYELKPSTMTWRSYLGTSGEPAIVKGSLHLHTPGVWRWKLPRRVVFSKEGYSLG